MVRKDLGNEVIVETTAQKITYHFVNEEKTINILSKEEYCKEDKLIVFPFFIDNNDQTKSKYGVLKSITFEGFKRKIPVGFLTSAKYGYGATSNLKPLMKFVGKSLPIENLTISVKNKSELGDNILILNYFDLERIRKQLIIASKVCSETNASFLNNYFARLFKGRFFDKIATYQKGYLSKVLEEYSGVEKNLSVEDKQMLIKLFNGISISKKGLVEKQELFLSREKLDVKFFEDALVEFERLINQKRIREEKWQDFFKRNSWIISQVFAFPAVLFKDKAYVGGKTITNTDGKIVDFLYKNKLTRNAALIEIKKHTSNLLGTVYRGDDVFTVSKDLSGGVNQVLDQKETYQINFNSLVNDDSLVSFNPKCFLIIGKISSLTNKQQKSFELFRSALKDVEIITFDELHMRIKSMLDLFKGNAIESKLTK